MTTRAKISTLVTLLFILSLLVVGYFIRHSRQQQEAYLEHSRKQIHEASDAIAEIWEVHLYWVIYDFSTWDDMVHFVSDPAALQYDIAEEYLEDLLPWYEVDGVWIFSADDDLIYQDTQGCADHLPGTSFSEDHLRQLHEENLMQYYQVVNDTLMLIQGATIHKTEDTEREGEPQGYMFMSKCWSGELLHLLEAMTGSDVKAIAPQDTINPASLYPDSFMRVPYKGKDGEHAAYLEFSKRIDFSVLLQDNAVRMFLIILIFSIFAFVSLSLAIHYWVTRPLKQTGDIIRHSKTEQIPQLKKASRDFEMIGGLIETFIKQKDDLEVQKEKAEEANRLKTAFLANVSHEIRTPMTGVMGFSELLKTEKDLTPEEQQQYLDLIYSNGQHLLRLIDDLIDLAKIDSGNVTVKNETFDVADLMLELYATYHKNPLLVHKGLELKFEEDQSLESLHITSDHFRLYQVLSNLLSNAIKFTEQGGIRIGYFMTDEKEIRFHVKDTGRGISEEDQDKIFKRFVQLEHEKAESKHQGTGLGLSICSGIMQLLGGSIKVESEPGKGTAFYVILPLPPRYTG